MIFHFISLSWQCKIKAIIFIFLRQIRRTRCNFCT